jgi:hypothetical protein
LGNATIEMRCRSAALVEPGPVVLPVWTIPSGIVGADREHEVEQSGVDRQVDLLGGEIGDLAVACTRPLWITRGAISAT